jgi:DNA repair protein SbcD/Mre11
LCAEPAPPDRGGIVRIATRDEEAVIAALPYVPERYVVDAWRLLDPEQEGYKDYAIRVAAMMDHLAESFAPSTVNILLGHMFVEGADTTGSEWSVHVSLPYAVPPSRLPAGAQYVALGHLHRSHRLHAAPVPAQYAGSPLQLDFGEQGQSKSVALVHATAGQPARVETIPLLAGRSLRTVEGTLEDLRAMAAHFGSDYLRVYVRLAEPVTALADQVREFLPNAVQVRPSFSAVPSLSHSQPGPRSSPAEQFTDWHLRHHTVPASEPLLGVFRKLYEEARHAAG